MAKRAFLVLGPESSGNRFVTECFIKAGCDGDPDHEQRFDRTLDGAEDTIVWRRSLPYGGGNHRWPDLETMLKKLQERDYNVRVIALLRNQYCTEKSQVGLHVKTREESARNIVSATRRIASFILENNLPAQYVTYESLIYNWSAFTRVLKEWGLKLIDPPKELKDGNAKYLMD